MLFFLWALGVNLNDVLIPHLKKVFDLTDFRSSLIQAAFFDKILPIMIGVQRISVQNQGCPEHRS
jgi:fucose permease